jgi:trimethylamine:corrinoid methyltransferase-like protein
LEFSRNVLLIIIREEGIDVMSDQALAFIRRAGVSLNRQSVDWFKGDLITSLEKLISDYEMLQHTPAIDKAL